MERILVVDDNPENREYLVSLLRYQDYEVHEAADGQEALNTVRKTRPDLVICDILMPVLDGYGFIHRLRRDPAIAGTRVLFYTAHYLEHEAKELAAGIGVARVLEKPCEPEEMLRNITEVLEATPTRPVDGALETFRDDHLRLITDKLHHQTSEVNQLNQKLAAMVELNLQLASEKNPHQLLNEMCNGARELLGARYASLAVRNGHNGKPHYFTTSGIELDRAADLKPANIEQGLLGDVIKTSRIQRIGKSAQEINSGLPDGYPGYSNLIAAPVSSLTNTYGWLCLTEKADGSEFDDEDELILGILGAQTGRIYENGSLYSKIRYHSNQLEQEVTRRSRIQQRLETQYSVSDLLSRTNSIDDAVPKLLETIAINTGFDVGFLWTVDEDQEALFLQGAWYSEQSPALSGFVEKARALSIPRNTGLSGEVWETAEPGWLPDLLDELERYTTPPELVKNYRDAGLHAAAAFPILLQDNVWGTMSFYSREIMMEDDEALKMFNAISIQISQFLDRQHQQESINRLNRMHAVLSGINNTIVHVNDREELYRRTCDIAVDQGKLQLAWIGFFDATTGKPQSLTIRGSGGFASAGTVRKKLDRKKDRKTVISLLSRSEPVIRNQLKSGQTVNFPLADEAVRHGTRSAAAFPLVIDGHTTGLLALYSREQGFFDEDELSLLKELAGDLAYAMQYLRNEEQLNFLAYHEPITGLNNRVAMYLELARVTKLAAEQQSPFAVLLVNINDFRDINDTLGHRNGDELLKKVAQRLRETVWKNDTVACLGGDNFAILLPRLADRDHIHLVIAKISKSLQTAFTVSGLPVNIEITIGISQYPEHGTSADVLWQHADVALRHARQSHKQHAFYSEEIDEYDPQRLSLIGELRNAIENDELVLHYQPLVDLELQQTIGVEALLRWDHPEHGIIYPDQFIPYSEHTGLINHLTSWVLRNAVRQVCDWNGSGLDLQLALNISAYNLHNPDFAGEVLEVLRDHRFPLQNLSLEITETAIMVDPELAGQVLMHLYNAGIHICIDDFGTGQSSLSYLKDLPVNRMKIDKSFVIGMHEPRNNGIVKSAVDLAHNLDLVVIAEGVEDEDSLRRLQHYRCDHAQGYYISRPMAAEKLADWLRVAAWPCVTDKSAL